MCNQDFAFVPAEWKTTLGRGVKIALFDTGVALTHPALSHLDQPGNRFDVAGTSFDPITSTGQDPVDDAMFNGTFHGTQMAGILSARSTDPSLCHGIAPDASVIICKMRDINSESYATYFAKGLQLALRLGVDIISCAFTPTFKEPFDHQHMERLMGEIRARKIALVTTNANTAQLAKLNTLSFPANQPGAIVTAALQDSMLRQWRPTDQLHAAFSLVTPEMVGTFCGDPGAPALLVSGKWKNSHATAALSGILALLISFWKRTEGALYQPRNAQELIAALTPQTPVFQPATLIADKTPVFYHR